MARRLAAKALRKFCKNSITHIYRTAIEGHQRLWEIRPMNVGRGLFRGWIFLTVLWLIGAGTLAYFIIRGEVSNWKWQYIHELRTNTPLQEIDWSRPYYEIMRSPSAEKLS